MPHAAYSSSRFPPPRSSLRRILCSGGGAGAGRGPASLAAPLRLAADGEASSRTTFLSSCRSSSVTPFGSAFSPLIVQTLYVMPCCASSSRWSFGSTEKLVQIIREFWASYEFLFVVDVIISASAATTRSIDQRVLIFLLQILPRDLRDNLQNEPRKDQLLEVR